MARGGFTRAPFWMQALAREREIGRVWLCLRRVCAHETLPTALALCGLLVLPRRLTPVRPRGEGAWLAENELREAVDVACALRTRCAVTAVDV
eukprot:2348148-Pleurochrysis_carterae.AAC.1